MSKNERFRAGRQSAMPLPPHCCLAAAATTMAPAVHAAHAAKAMHAAKRQLVTTNVTPVESHVATAEHVFMGTVEVVTVEVVMVKAAANSYAEIGGDIRAIVVR